VVNDRLEIVYFSYCVPPCGITDYRAAWSGITPETLKGAPPFHQVPY
jgi:DNA polymerase III epsilon subunit-like protein